MCPAQSEAKMGSMVRLDNGADCPMYTRFSAPNALDNTFRYTRMSPHACQDVKRFIESLEI
jgi:hypothetical protein